MKHIILSLVIFFFSACASEQIISDSGKELKVSKDLSGFLNQFELAVVNHDKAKLVSLIDRSYIEKHYSGLSEHDKEYFFREFFCGKDLKTGMTVCPGFNELDKIRFVSIHNDTEGTYTIRYIVYTIYEELSAVWTVTVKKNNEHILFGIKTSFG